MTWVINVKPTDHTLVWFVWTAQRQDGGEGYLFGSTPLHSQAEALAEAKEEITLYTDRQKVIADNSIVNEEFTPVAEGEA